MKLYKLFIAVTAGLIFSGVTSHAQLTLNFSSTPGATIQFNGAASSFQFNTSTSNLVAGSQWQIGSEVGGTGAAVNLFGVVTNGPFGYGPVTTPFAGLQIANVTNVPFGALAINDGTGDFLTGDVAWVQLDTFQFSGGINANLTVNVTNVAYIGSNPDLLTLAAESPASMDLTFQFAPGMTLSSLTTGPGPYDTSFSGSLVVTPEPTSIGLFLAGSGLLIFIRRLRQI